MSEDIFWQYCQASIPENERIFILAWPDAEPPEGPWASILSGPEEAPASIFTTHETEEESGIKSYINRVVKTSLTINFFRGETLRDARRFRHYLESGSKELLDEISGNVTRLSSIRPVNYNDGQKKIHRHQIDFTVTWKEKFINDNNSIDTINISGDFK